MSMTSAGLNARRYADEGADERTYDDDDVLTRARALVETGKASGQIHDLVSRIDDARACDPYKRPGLLFLRLSRYLQGYPE